jgi:hypothetical protein
MFARANARRRRERQAPARVHQRLRTVPGRAVGELDDPCDFWVRGDACVHGSGVRMAPLELSQGG